MNILLIFDKVSKKLPPESTLRFEMCQPAYFVKFEIKTILPSYKTKTFTLCLDRASLASMSELSIEMVADHIIKKWQSES